ncbi:hypothetical protein ABVT39_018759 [Epinephelus coioides]
MDVIGLAERLPVLTDGADKWIMALEETTAGIQLALGDIKAILTYVAGKQTTLEIFTDARLSAAIGSNAYNDESFGHHRSRVWQQLRAHYPAKRDPSKLEGETMADDECPSKFLHNFQKRWKEETGEAWNANKTTQSLFKMMVKKAMPEDVQRVCKHQEAAATSGSQGGEAEVDPEEKQRFEEDGRGFETTYQGTSTCTNKPRPTSTQARQT